MVVDAVAPHTTRGSISASGTASAARSCDGKEPEWTPTGQSSTKRDTRAFLEKAVPEETVRRIVQAGRMAGSSKNTQPCRFVIIDDQRVKEEFAKCGDFATWIPQAPLVVAIAVIGGTRPEFDAGRAAQNMMVAAWAEDVGSCPISLHRQDCAVDALGLPADARARRGRLRLSREAAEERA